MVSEALSSKDAERPCFHVMPPAGWMNDPNGPIFFEGRYHLFYQHLNSGCEWNWGIVWGHASSEDLLRWEHHPLALEPTFGSNDADGCFSGCCVVDDEGIPTILYTGVRLRSNPHCGPLPPEENDLQLPFIESQLMAVADIGTTKLTEWTKLEKPFLALPPSGMELTGWRDPFVFHRGDGMKDWVLLMGSGIKDQGGTVLVYKASALLSDWRLDGCLCSGNLDTGAMWECPLLLKLNSSSHSSISNSAVDQEKPAAEDSHSLQYSTPDKTIPKDRATAEFIDCELYLFCVSPDAPTNPVICWIGHYENERFALESAKGPFRLDLGDVLYAPNTATDEKGRCLLWGWLQERRKVGTYDYAGCLSVPRVLSAREGKLLQEPSEEVRLIRKGKSWKNTDLIVSPENSVPLPGLSTLSLDLQITLERGMSNAAGVLLHSWHVSGEGSAVIIFDWDRRNLEVVFEAVDPETMEFCINSSSSHRVGGIIDFQPGTPLCLRILIDHSVLEVFTGSGEVLSTRVYRGEPPCTPDEGVEFVSFGGTANLVEVEAYEMDSIFSSEPSTIDDMLVKHTESSASQVHDT